MALTTIDVVEAERDTLSCPSDPQIESPEKPKEETVVAEPESTTNAAPDGGMEAWLQVAGSWILFFNTWGILNTFGIFQTYYESGALFRTTSSNISWIGSIQALMVLVGGAISGPIYDRGGFRWLLLVGSFGVIFGHMMLSLCKSYWQVLLAQGFLVGIGGGCLYVPAVAILPTYFSKSLGLALGVAASGSSMGGIIYPILFYQLVGRIGFGWAVRTLAFLGLATLVVPIAVMRVRVKPAQIRSIIDWTAFRDGPYITFVGGCLIGFTGLYVAFFYISYFGQQSGITDARLSFYLVPILNAGSVFGRTVPNWLSDKTGPLNIIAPSAFMMGVVLLCNLAVHNIAGLVIITLLLGVFTGVFVALPPAILVALTKDKSKIGTRIGMGLALAGLGVFPGGPGAGAILGNGEILNWSHLWGFAGAVALVSSGVFVALRVWRGGFRWIVKV